MDTDFAELELILDRHPKGAYTLGMRFRSAGSHADRRLPAFKTKLDPEDLRTHWGFEEHADYEKRLRRQLFSSEKARTFFQVSLAMAQAVASSLRIQVTIEPTATKLHDIVWEVLRDPLSERPLATAENIWFSRYVMSQDCRPILLSTYNQLQVVVMAASPSDISDYQLKSFDAQEEITRIIAPLKKAEISVQPLPDEDKKWRAALNNLISTIQEKKANLVYLVCHGAIGRDEQPCLYLEDDEGKTALVYGRDFVNRLTELSSLPQLVILTSCESAGKELSQTAKALGPMLADAGVPAVLAMHGQITQETIRRFMPAFFLELQHDGQIDRALSVARGQIKDRFDVWMPVLFLRSKSGKLWKEDLAIRPKCAENQPIYAESDLNPANETAIALLAVLNQQEYVATNNHRREWEPILRSFPIDQCSPEYNRKIWEKRREIGCAEPPQWRLGWPPPASIHPSAQFFIAGKFSDPFINERAEVEKSWLFCKKESLFWAHPLFEQLNSDTFPLSVVVGEHGMGKTAHALALGQYRHSNKTLGIYLKQAPQLPEIYQAFASRLLEFIRLHPTYLVYLVPEERSLLVRLLSSYLGQASLLSSLSRASSPKEWDWLQEAKDDETLKLWKTECQIQLQLLIREAEKTANASLSLSEWPVALYNLTQAFRFETTRLIIDVNTLCSPSWLEEVIFKPYQTWTQIHCQVVLFLHRETANQWDQWIEKDFAIYPLSWQANNQNLLKTMALNRWDVWNPNKDITMAIEMELLEQLIANAKGNPGKFIVLWKEYINSKSQAGA